MHVKDRHGLDELRHLARGAQKARMRIRLQAIVLARQGRTFQEIAQTLDAASRSVSAVRPTKFAASRVTARMRSRKSGGSTGPGGGGGGAVDRGVGVSSVSDRGVGVSSVSDIAADSS